MFVIKQSDTFRWPVKFDLPVDGGKTAPQTFDAEFKRLGQARLAELAAALEDAEGAEKIVREVLVGWAGITDGDQPVPFSQGALGQVLDIPGVVLAVVRAYTKAMTGEAARKN